jgi:hypothetical protein
MGLRVSLEKSKIAAAGIRIADLPAHSLVTTPSTLSRVPNVVTKCGILQLVQVMTFGLQNPLKPDVHVNNI